MSLVRNRKRRGASITSLIDVIFLLLLFFMLASTFSKRAELEIIASADGPSNNESSETIRLLVSMDSLHINGQSVSEAALISDLGKELQEPDSIIAVELTDDVTTQRLVDILLMLKSAPNARIHIAEPS